MTPHNTKALMKTTRRYAAIIVALVMGAMHLLAQEVMVTVTPIQQTLPPQVHLYTSQPGRYFTVTLINSSPESKRVYLGLQVEQIVPANLLALSTPPKRQPQEPIVLAPSATRTLSPNELAKMFNYLPVSEIASTPGLIDNYNNGAFGLLPEGQYRIRLTAYSWNPEQSTPRVMSNPNGGTCIFNVCYKAQAPEFLQPQADFNKPMSAVELSPENALFTWKAPVVSCATAQRFKYNFKVVEVLPGQNPDDAVRNGVRYQANNLTTPTCIIPLNAIRTQFRPDVTYMAFVEASAMGVTSNYLNYVMIENEGRSNLRLFRFVDKKEKPTKSADKTTEKNEEKDSINISGETGEEKETTAKTYQFKNPQILTPTFYDDTNRKVFKEEDIDVSWRRAWHTGGSGLRADTVKFQYDVELFKGKSREVAFKGKPIFKKEKLDSLNCKIKWSDFMGKVDEGDMLVLRVVPKCTDKSDIELIGDDNVKDFVLDQRLTQKLTLCPNGVEITNTTPINKLEKGDEITIGEFKMVIDEIEKREGKKSFAGKGRVLWNPGIKAKVRVIFDDLFVNTDKAVYQGVAKTEVDKSKLDNTTVQKLQDLFSNAGIDNLMGSLGENNLAKVANEIDNLKLGGFLDQINTGAIAAVNLISGEEKDLLLPARISLPRRSKDAAKNSIVNVNLVGMEFAPQYATMNLLGGMKMPEGDTTDPYVLLAAPRVCVKPDKLFPNAGHLSLLKDVTCTDKSGYNITFKAPKDFLNPQDGCYMVFGNDSIGGLHAQMEMNIPQLCKDNNGEVVEGEHPKLTIAAYIHDWDDWTAEAKMEAFQHKSVPGFTFNPGNVVIDHSAKANARGMVSFPEGYDKAKAGITTSELAWQGIYIGNVEVKLPKSFKLLKSGNDRAKVLLNHFFVDKSGISMSSEINNLFSAGYKPDENGNNVAIGGWGFAIKTMGISVVQNSFNKFFFEGQCAVPLIKDNAGNARSINFECNVHNLKQADRTQSYPFVFKSQLDGDGNLDFILAKLKLAQDQTYFLVESKLDKDGKDDTGVELCLGGELSIGVVKKLSKKMGLTLPGIHFTQMRLSNKPEGWESKYEKEMQHQAKKHLEAGTQLYKAKEVAFKNNSLFFSFGRWSLASAQKKIGPFDFTLNEFKFGTDEEDGEKLVTLTVGGEVAIVDGFISGGTAVTIRAKLDGEKKDLKYKDTQLNSIKVGCNIAGVVADGEFSVIRADKSAEIRDEGYQGTLKMAFPGNIFSFHLEGSIMTHTETVDGKETHVKWGHLLVGAGSTALTIPPVSFDDISGGFYINCKPEATDLKKVSYEKGIIGWRFGVTLGITGTGGTVASAKLDLVTAIGRRTDENGNKNIYLSSIILNGELSGLASLVKGNVSIVYDYNYKTKAKTFRINITAESGFGVNLSKDEVMQKLAQAAGTAGKDAGQIPGIDAIPDDANSVKEALLPGSSKLHPVPEQGLTGLEEKNNSSGGVNKEEVDDKKKSFARYQAGESIPIEFYICNIPNKEGEGKTKWHFYLGNPVEEGKKCQITYIKFDSKVVKADIGASAYLCLGNDGFPGGKMPDIPLDIKEFLNGSTKGAGVQSAQLSEDLLKNSRETIEKAFTNTKEKNACGVMLGACIWGKIQLDLGVLYGKMGAIGGFDIALSQLKSAYCANINGEMGHGGWYGVGQIYAHLYAKLGLNINLGFYKGQFDILDAGLGGILQCGMPHPSWAKGLVRCKLELLAGLIKINRAYKFECGKVCDVFYGNALDDFKMFNGCTIGSENQKEGWNDDNKVSCVIDHTVSFDTQVSLNNQILVADPNIMKNYTDLGLEDAQAAALANRCFMFKVNRNFELYEYSNSSGKEVSKIYKAEVVDYNKENSSTMKLMIYDEQKRSRIMHLKPNMYYKLVLTGYAKELYQGAWVNPIDRDPKLNRPTSKAWSDSKEIYFCTDGNTNPPTSKDIEVALAFPSDNGKLDTGNPIPAYLEDVQAPVVALTKKYDLMTSGTSERSLWELQDENKKILETRRNRNVVVEGNRTQYSLMSESPFTEVSTNKKYFIVFKRIKPRVERKITYTTSRNNEGLFVEDTTNTQSIKEQVSKIISQTKLDEKSKERLIDKLVSTASKTSAIYKRIDDGTKYALSDAPKGNAGSGTSMEDAIRQGIIDDIRKRGRVESAQDFLGSLGLGGGRRPKLPGNGGINGGNGGNGGIVPRPDIILPGEFGQGLTHNYHVRPGQRGGRVQVNADFDRNVGRQFEANLANSIGKNGLSQASTFSANAAPAIKASSSSSMLSTNARLGNAENGRSELGRGGIRAVGKGMQNTLRSKRVEEPDELFAHGPQKLNRGRKFSIDNSNKIELTEGISGEKQNFDAYYMGDSKSDVYRRWKKKVSTSVQTITVYDTTTVFTLNVNVIPGNWKDGFTTGYLKGQQAGYSQPFVSQKLNYVEWANDDFVPSDRDIAKTLGNNCLNNDPAKYLSFIGDVAFLGNIKLRWADFGKYGDELGSDTELIGQSLIYTTPLGTIHGEFNKMNTYSVSSRFKEYRKLSVYDEGARCGKDASWTKQWPLFHYPKSEARTEQAKYWSELNKFSDPITPLYYNKVSAINGDQDRVDGLLRMLHEPYVLANRLSIAIYDKYWEYRWWRNHKWDGSLSDYFISRLRKVNECYINNGKATSFLSVSTAPYFEGTSGVYSSVKRGSKLEVPLYQIAFIWGSTGLARYQVELRFTGKHAGLKDHWRDSKDISDKIYEYIAEWEPGRKCKTKSYRGQWYADKANNDMKAASFTIFRVNAYDTWGMYGVDTNSNGAHTYEFILNNPLQKFK